jgi:hypothetical protein
MKIVIRMNKAKLFCACLTLTRRLGERSSLGLAVGTIPTRLHAGIHNLPTIDAPKANSAYCPDRFSFFDDILRWSIWRVHAGNRPQQIPFSPYALGVKILDEV